ncbi:MAG: alpha-ketoacid dehydrogenase subunit beta [Verrucomicrobiales bacterium]|jgi:pyruvate dehydrogenase E1 component beta subunit|nr:alpha-ketoacid dehydrogenase subunit beta [Verrucomicrobiales bacterium]|tara:strand:- start:5395 stop:6390 length:996 start_codon:yes stop_codon:yes gene_type:complete
MPREITYREALREGLDEELAHDDNVVIIGEEVAEYNGAYKVTEGLWNKWGDKRVIDAPISEAGFIGMGIGASMLGVRPVMELMFYSFAYVAFDQMMNNAATCRYMSGGLINVPIVVRGPANGGTNVGATHSHTPENIFANMPGLKVVSPSDAYDVKGLIKSSIRDNDPVYFMESTVLYGMSGEVPSNDELDDGELIVPIGKAKVKREGADISLIAHGRAVVTSLAAADILADKYNIHAEVLDLRSIRPIDEQAIMESVRKTHRAIYVEENKPFCGIGAQVSSMIMEQAFDDLDAPVLRITSADAPAFYSPAIEKLQLPAPEEIVERALTIC